MNSLIHTREFCNTYQRVLFTGRISPCGLGDQSLAKVFPCACRKRRLIKSYRLSYTTGLLYAWPSCKQWGMRVWTVGHWVVLVQGIYCSTGGWVVFSINQWHPWGEILSYSHSRKPGLPITHSSPFSMWLSILFIVASPAKTTLSGQGYWFCWWRLWHCHHNCSTTIFFCVLYCKHQTVYGFFF